MTRRASGGTSSRHLIPVLVAALATLWGCGRIGFAVAETDADGGPVSIEAGVDGGTDAGNPNGDAEVDRDAGTDGSTGPLDVGPPDSGALDTSVPDVGPPDSGALDAGGGCPLALGCNPTFGPPQLIAELDSRRDGEYDPTLTADELEILFYTTRDRSINIYTARRSDIGAPWDAPTVVTTFVGLFVDNPDVSGDGLLLHLTVGGARDIQQSRRADRSSAWSAPVPIPSLEAPGLECCLIPYDGDTRAFLTSDQSGTLRLHETRRATPLDAWAAPTPAAPITSMAVEANPYLLEDGLVIFFDAGPDLDNRDLYFAYRASIEGSWSAPVALDEINSIADDRDAWVSPDAERIYFSSDRSGDYAIYVATRVP